MRKPLPLRKADVIAVCAPAGPVNEGRLRRGIARLAAAGFVPEIAEGILAVDRCFAGEDGHRARQVEWALSLPEARAVMAARGGYGTTRLLPLLDWRKAARRPKLLVGFSDLTAILAYLSTRLRLPCIHGPMVAADLALRFDAGALDAFARLAAGKVSPKEPWGEPMERLRGGAADGMLTGGCLSVLTALLATPYSPDFRGALLFLEDVQEPVYRLDRMLTQWIQSGRWSQLAGILVGKMAPARGETVEDLQRVFHDAGKRLSVPVWYGFPAGHDGRNVALPFGVRARVDAKGRLFLLEPPVGEG
ncbi:MAG: LD-carboxypeptidase [Thermodesulfobacteriota bacterium]